MKIPFTKSNGGEQSLAPLTAALVFVALVPTVGVLWFMSVAMRNERLAVQQRLAEVYANHLISLQPRVTAFVSERQAALRVSEQRSPAENFAALVRANVADGVVVRDPAGKMLYPQAANGAAPASESADVARALQTQAAGLLKAGQKAQALAKLTELVSDSRWRNAVSAGGALLVPNAQLLILKAAEADSALRQQALNDLVTRLNDYSDGAMLSNQRRFLMTEVKSLAPELKVFSTFAAEELAADYLEHEAPVPTDGKPAAVGKLQSTALAKVWALVSADRTVVALFREERLRAQLEKFLAPFVLPDAHVMVLAPSVVLSAHAPIMSQDAGELLPGWRLALGFGDRDPLASASKRQTRIYLLIGFLVVLIIAVVAVLVARYVAAQMRLARLKNELVSTVSHELKTPLASMRALVDTLAAGSYRDERQLREYLDLIAKENVRLSHLIDNFLTFSRLERGKQPFRFEALDPASVVADAVDALQEKLGEARCAFASHVEPGLPQIRGDAGALSTVLINLLDNAYKYTDVEKRISARAYARGRHVCFEVADNGIGFERSEVKKIFDRFYQVDQSLTRQRGGCGLGLGIVQQIVRAHDGDVQVESEPGKGSTFRVMIPIEPRHLSQSAQSPEREHRERAIAP